MLRALGLQLERASVLASIPNAEADPTSPHEDVPLKGMSGQSWPLRSWVPWSFFFFFFVSHELKCPRTLPIAGYIESMYA